MCTFLLCFFLPGLDVCACNEGFSLDIDDRTCVDVNECLDGTTHTCDLDFGVCTNTIGNYNCSCFDGYILGPQYQCQGQKTFGVTVSDSTVLLLRLTHFCTKSLFTYSYFTSTFVLELFNNNNNMLLFLMQINRYCI